jgi:predicted AAA+ superfamily ATPase
VDEFLWENFHRLIAELEPIKPRFLYRELDAEHRLTGIIGQRGVGKTTLMLQYLKEHFYDDRSAFYFSADAIYFNDNTILEFVNELYQQHGVRNFFIDEVHKYKNWSQELKNIYDSFPKAKIYFSGSSSIDLIQGSYDLSRRARLLKLPGLSFREYLNIKNGTSYEPISLEELLIDHQKLAADLIKETGLLKQFEGYQKQGYYPFVFTEEAFIYSALANVIDKTIYEDVAIFYNLHTSNLQHLRRIINFLASIPPGKVSTNNLAKHIGIDNKTAAHYLEILTRTGLVRTLSSVAHGNQQLTKQAKVYLDNSTLLTASNVFLSEQLDVGNLRELTFLQLVNGAGLQAFYPKKGDFQIENTVFEVGGKNKTKKQLKGISENSVVVKADTLIGSEGVIPLYLFGFLY